jgi:exonuclease SbcC
MIPVRLEIKNFLPYKTPAPLDFTGIRLACLSGENGAGKSSILDAITWALWGKARDGKRPDDDLIHHHETDMHVTFEFELNESHYQVMRQRKSAKRGQSNLVLQVFDQHDNRWRGLSEATLSATQKKINQLLHLDYDTFCNSALLQQGRADAFTVKSPGERKAVLATILGLEQWEKYAEHAKTLLQESKFQLDALRTGLQDIDKELARLPVYQQALADAERHATAITAQLTVAEQQFSEVEQAGRAYSETLTQMESLQQRLNHDRQELRGLERELQDKSTKANHTQVELEIAQLNAKVDDLEAKDIQMQELREKRTNALTQRSQLDGENNGLRQESDPIKKRLHTLQETVDALCPTCGSSLSYAAKMQLLNTLESELDRRRNQYTQNQALQRQLDHQIGQFEQTLNALSREIQHRTGWQRRISELQSLLLVAHQAQAEIPIVQARIQRQQDFVRISEREILKLQQDAHQLQMRSAVADQQKKELTQLRLQQRTATEKVGSAKQQLAALEGLKQKRASILRDTERLQQNISLQEELHLAFGKNGVPAMLIEAAVPELEQLSNDLLTRMTNGQMHVSFETQRGTKSGDTRETLDIKISDDLGTRDYEMYSGGESFRVNFAIRVGLSKLLARRAGAQLQTLIIDEGFGTQDAQGRERLVEAINTIQDDFRCILVVTHIDELKDAFPTRINVRKWANGSEIWIE